MKVDGTNLHLVLHIRQAQDGTLSSKIDSIDQDAANISVETIDFAGGTLRLDVARVSATYTGVLTKNGKELKGVWTEGKDHNLTFKKVPNTVTLVQPVWIGGDWEGAFSEAGVQKDVYLHINTTSCTTIVGTLDIPGGGATAVQIRKITFQNGNLAFSVESLGANYSGTLTDNGTKFEGVWKRGDSHPFILQRALHPFRVYEHPHGCRGSSS